jgi:hypothetical protein
MEVVLLCCAGDTYGAEGAGGFHGSGDPRGEEVRAAWPTGARVSLPATSGGRVRRWSL